MRIIKTCYKCGITKPMTLEYFGKFTKSKDGFRNCCKKCRSLTEYEPNKEVIIEKRKVYYANNKERVATCVKKYRINNIDWYQSYNQKYYEEHMAQMKESSKKSLYRRIEENSGFKILQRLRKRMYEAVKGNVKSARTQELIGCTVEKLQEHLEMQFREGMTWDNYGRWHVDHIIPCDSFDFTKPEQQRACFSYTNLQPLWAIENLRKSNKIIVSE